MLRELVVFLDASQTKSSRTQWAWWDLRTLEIEADVYGGVPENVARTATENSRTLKFGRYGFEQE